MELAHIVLLILVAIAVIAIAGHLIAVALILKRVVDNLTVVLGAVQAVTETAQPVGAIIDEINRDLDSGRKLIENGVERLEDSRAPVGAQAEEPSRRHAVAESAPDTVGGGSGSAPDTVGGGSGTATAAPPAPGDVDADRFDQPSPERKRGWFNRET